MYQRILKFSIVCALCAFSGVGVAAVGDPFFSQDPAYATPVVIMEGKKISLSVEQMNIRALLEMIAQSAHVNMMISDEVKGTVTLSLKNIPWDEAVQLILNSKGLGQQKMGQVIYIAPLSELVAQEKQALALKQQNNASTPLNSAFFIIKYANAEALKVLLESQGDSFLGPRGKVSVDKRTNTLVIQDTPEQMEHIKKLLAHLDVPVTQVLIEARIVMMDQRAKEELGATLKRLSIGNHTITHDEGVFNWNVAALPSHFALDLELRAMESEGESKVISSPHLTVANNQAATIQQGQEIPYQTQTPTGATQIEYKQAVLGLVVTPQITPDGKILMQLQISDDHVSSDKSTVATVPLVDTSRMSTQVLVNNNQTLMLGGIVKETHDHSVRKTPLLGDIPGLGFFFRNTTTENNRTELVIFVTPKIIELNAP